MINVILLILYSMIIVIVYCEIRKWFIQRKLRCFESPSQLPILGVAGRFLGKPNDRIIDIVFDIYKEVKTTPVQLWFGPLLAVGVSEPEDIRIILSNENCLDKPYFYQHLKCKSSIIASERDVWKPDRHALNTAFNVNILHSYAPAVNEKARILIRKLEACLHETGDLYRIIFIYMLDTIVRTTLGTEINMQCEIDVERGPYYYGIFKQIMENIQYRVARYWLRWDLTYALTKVCRDEKILLKIGNELFETGHRRMKNHMDFLATQTDDKYQANETKCRNFLDKCIRMEQNGWFDSENVLDQMRLIVFAGTDTLSITTFGTLLMLAINQKHQDLVVEELQSIFESADCDVTKTHLANMQYTERVIKESHRLLAPVPFIGRKTSAEIELPKGTVPKDTIIFINIMHLHHNPKIWGENVLEFDPDRFLPENIAKRPKCSFIPFSYGSRNCIGMK